MARLEPQTPAEYHHHPIAALKARGRNPRTHTVKQIRQIATSIERFGFINPVLIDADLGIVAGHGRVEAARLLGMTEVPTIMLEHLTPSEVAAYVIADNRLAELAGWDEELLAEELSYITELEIDFDLTVTGFETCEIDILLDDVGKQSGDEADKVPEPPAPARICTKPGDVWLLGEHRLVCGDAREATAYKSLLRGEQAGIVITDPPYNVPIGGHVNGLGRIRHEEFAMASGEMSAEAFTEFLTKTFEQLVAHSVDGSIHFVFMDWRHLREILDAGESCYTELKNLCVWNKTNSGMGSLYRSKHELIFVFKNGVAAHTNNVALGAYGRNRTNVWDYAGVNAFGEGRLDEFAMHPTVKPVALITDAIRDCSRRGDIVLDCFGGSGTTLIAAERCGRRGRVIELAPGYVDTTIERYEKLTSAAAVHEASGETFEAMRAARTRTSEAGKEVGDV